MKPSLLLLPLLAAGCATATAASPAAPTVVPPDLGGHQYDRPHADRVLVAGDSVVLDVPGGRARVTVGGPALRVLPALPKALLHRYDARFTVTVTSLSGAPRVSPADFRLLAIADQVDGGAVVTTTQTVTTLAATVVAVGRTITGTWTAPFVEGHGELLYTPEGAARPAALWDFRAES